MRKNPTLFDLLFLFRFFSLALDFLTLSLLPSLSLYLKHIIKKSQTCGRPEFIARFLSFYEREEMVNNLPKNTSHAAAYTATSEGSCKDLTDSYEELVVTYAKKRIQRVHAGQNHSQRER